MSNFVLHRRGAFDSIKCQKAKKAGKVLSVRSQGKKARGRRWLAAGAMLLLAVGLLLWLGWGGGPGSSVSALQPEETQPAEAPAALPPASVPAAAGSPLPTPTPEPEPEEKIPAFLLEKPVYAPSLRPDGRKVEPREGLCFWGMDQLDTAAKIHRCRFISGSGQLLPDYEWGLPVPLSEAVEPEFFSDAAFIGNSLAQGFMLYAGLKTADQFAVQSITVSNIGTEKVIRDGEGGFISILDALALKPYGKVFVMLGINELSWAGKDTFYTLYSELIDLLRELQPGAEIYLQSMTPVTAEESQSSTVFTNDRIHEYNEVIRQLAEDKETHYLYVFDALADETGCLPPGSSNDGIHPYPNYCPQWLTYLETHTVTEVRP